MLRRLARALAPRLAESRIPWWVKLAYSAFVCILVPYYWRNYGPTNFLYFCDVAVFMVLVALWREDPLWASMPAVGILLPQTLWMVDFLGGLCGMHVVGMTAYMFDTGIPLFTRALSLFHFWLPLLLLWIIWRLGYDRRAFRAWTALAWALLLVGYFLMPAPPAPPENPTSRSTSTTCMASATAGRNSGCRCRCTLDCCWPACRCACSCRRT